MYLIRDHFPNLYSFYNHFMTQTDVIPIIKQKSYFFYNAHIKNYRVTACVQVKVVMLSQDDFKEFSRQIPSFKYFIIFALRIN